MWPELCSEGRLGKPGVYGSQAVQGWGGGRSPGSPQVRQSVSQPQRACPCQSEVENRHIKEVTDTFTLIQVVDVIVVSRGWRKAEEGCKHCREQQAEAPGPRPHPAATQTLPTHTHPPPAWATYLLRTSAPPRALSSCTLGMEGELSYILAPASPPTKAHEGDHPATHQKLYPLPRYRAQP